jgi:hypothetical protein
MKEGTFKGRILYFLIQGMDTLFSKKSDFHMAQTSVLQDSSFQSTNQHILTLHKIKCFEMI